MAYSRAGIRRFITWKKGTADTYPFSMNVRKGSSLIIEPQVITDHRGREIPKSLKFTAEVEGYNVGRPALETLLAYINDGGVYAEILTEKTGASTYDGKYRFDSASKYLGTEFEYSISNEERLVKLMLNGDFPLAVGDDILTLGLLDGPATIGGIAEAAYATSEIRVPSFSFVKYGGSLLAMFEEDEIISRNFMIKTVKGSDTERGRAVVHAYEITGEFVVTNASKDKISAWTVLSDFAPAINIEEKDPSGKYERHNFAAGVLSVKTSTEISDEKREMKFTLKGQVPIYNVTAASSGGSYTYSYAL